MLYKQEAFLISLSLFSIFFCGVDVYTALVGAVGALYGPLHDGANDMCKFLIWKNIIIVYLLGLTFYYD